MSKQLTSRVVMILRYMILLLCLTYTFWLGYPPAHAQGQGTVEQEQIRELNKHIESTDGHVGVNQVTLQSLQTQLGHDEGIAQGFGILFTLLTGGTIVLQVRKAR